MIRFTIDGMEVKAEEGWTVLETARHYRVPIPTLCYHEAVKPSGACRLCVVEVCQGERSKIVASCMYPVSEGLEILSNSDRVRNVRRWILEMLLSECPGAKEVQSLAREYGVEEPRFKMGEPGEKCILCGLCVRVCEEVVGVRALSFGSRGISKEIATPYMEPSPACIACGSCVSVCPTGAMQERLDKVRGDISNRTGHGYAH
ncbi:MAG: 4Fe-4S dicluster domain-containing protein [Desulfobacteraceae bacterium]|nr:MAG: 4Fe-4S dicluster domain-containing protein [Desulfobacteraceae bacterium]